MPLPPAITAHWSCWERYFLSVRVLLQAGRPRPAVTMQMESGDFGGDYANDEARGRGHRAARSHSWVSTKKRWLLWGQVKTNSLITLSWCKNVMTERRKLTYNQSNQQYVS